MGEMGFRIGDRKLASKILAIQYLFLPNIDIAPPPLFIHFLFIYYLEKFQNLIQIQKAVMKLVLFRLFYFPPDDLTHYNLRPC